MLMSWEGVFRLVLETALTQSKKIKDEHKEIPDHKRERKTLATSRKFRPLSRCHLNMWIKKPPLMLFIRVNLNTFLKTKPEIFLCAKSISHLSVENTTKIKSDQTRKNVLRCVCCDIKPRRVFTSTTNWDKKWYTREKSMKNVNLRLFSVFLFDL